MLFEVLSNFTDLFVRIFTVLLIVRVVASYFANPGGQFFRGLVSITEPIIAPVRKLLPPMSGLDLAPLVTYIVMRVIQYIIHVLLGT